MKTRTPKVMLKTIDGAIVLYDALPGNALTGEEATRNIYRIHSDKTTMWQVASRPGAVGPFTNVYFDTFGALKAYAWDGGEYTLDMDSGEIVSSELVR